MKQTLTLDETKRLLALTTPTAFRTGHAQNRALFLAVLLCGAKARTWTWEDALSDVLQMPFAVYYALRDMACEQKLSIFPFSHAGFIPSAHVINGPRLQNAVFTATGRTALTTQAVREALRKIVEDAPGPQTTAMLVTQIALAVGTIEAVFGELDEIGRTAKSLK